MRFFSSYSSFFRLIPGLLLFLVLLLLPACRGAGGFLAGAFASQTIKAVYALDPETPTLVLVDDPENYLGDSSLRYLVAQQTTLLLSEQKKAPSLIETRKLSELALELGSQKIAAMPVDQIGRKLDAARVIHVHIENAAFIYELGMLRPSINARVKVIDTATGKRLFPPDNSSGLPVLGYLVSANLRYRTQEEQAIAMMPVLRHDLAQKLGVHIAQLFFDHEPPPKDGQPIGDDIQ